MFVIVGILVVIGAITTGYLMEHGNIRVLLQPAELVIIGGAALGTILIALVYLVANVALPFYYRRFHPDKFSPVRHLLLPGLGALAIGYPLYELVKPGQPHPFDRYPYVALGVVVLAALYGVYLNARDSTLGERIGSVIADAE